MLPKEALAEVEKELEGKGRVVLRASGTEPVVRVMVEAKLGRLGEKRRRKKLPLPFKVKSNSVFDVEVELNKRPSVVQTAFVFH